MAGVGSVAYQAQFDQLVLVLVIKCIRVNFRLVPPNSSIFSHLPELRPIDRLEIQSLIYLLSLFRFDSLSIDYEVGISLLTKR